MPDRHHTLGAVERLEHHRKAAKALLRAARAGDAAARARLDGAAPRHAGAQRAIAPLDGAALRLADAQRAGADIDRRNGLNGDNALGWAEYVLARERPGDPGVTAARDLLRPLR